MIEERQKQTLVERILKYFDIYETVFSLIFAAGIVMLSQNLPYWEIVLWTGTGFLALIYFLKNFQKREDLPFFLNFICVKVYWIGLSIIVLAITSKLLFRENSQNLLIFGLIFTFTSFLIKTYFWITKKYQSPFGDLIRFVLISLIGLFVLTF